MTRLAAGLRVLKTVLDLLSELWEATVAVAASSILSSNSGAPVLSC